MENNDDPSPSTEWSPPREPAPDVGDQVEPPPERIGRYRVVRLLGEGGFGRVYLAHDDDLDRPIAVKVPRRERISRPEDVEAYLAEARVLARLDHPGIVPVYDVGRTDDGLCFVVSKYVEGSDLATRAKLGRLGFGESAELIAAVAEALHFAHTRGLVHRDIKPANILLDASGRPSVADFGLALRDEDFGRGARFAGTPSYMSPEQARREGHRVDGRSDVFSLGVVLYELLTDRRPFRGDSVDEVLEHVVETDPRPPRQVDDAIARELERICLKALSKRASDRYSTARDMAEDLRLYVQTNRTGELPPSALATPTPLPLPPTPSETEQPVKVVPPGLRSFDKHDADFFLELLPGARDRDGLPESVRFWKSRIESADGDTMFRVGLIYGPSGCGKSSLVKAGLLPRLSKNVLTVYIEATAEETESRLLRGLRKVCPELPANVGLADAVATLRRGRALRAGQKVLLVLDQFEQWLFTHRGEGSPELVAALRQCDGEHVQAIVLVRDDFWLAVSRFMRDLEIDLEPGANIALVDLFDPRHARKVLRAFGAAYATLPDTTKAFSTDQNAFLDQTVAGLAQGGKVVSVRLALFAEMVKGKPWTPATLRSVGGTEGVGAAFLEETFASPQANPRHRLHRQAAQAVLRALLPRGATDIKGRMRSDAELRAASGYADRPRDFDDLIRILDAELRLITPTDPEGSTGDSPADDPAGDRYFQLTHDYLVPSLRDWLTRKQRESRRGRAELRLAERALVWSAKPEDRHLPSVLEWANISWRTQGRDWTESQRRMMRRAARVHGVRGLALAVVAAAAAFAVITVKARVDASNLVQRLLVAETGRVPEIINAMSAHRRWTDPELKQLLKTEPADSKRRLHASLALVRGDRSLLPFLEAQLLEAGPADLRVLREELKPHRGWLIPHLWAVLLAARAGEPRLLPAAAGLALYDPSDARWTAVGTKVADALVGLNPADLGAWLDALKGARNKLTNSLTAVFQDRDRPESQHALATSILADFARDDPELLGELLVSAGAKSFESLYPVAARRAAQVIPVLQAEIARKTIMDDEVAKDHLAQRQARAAVALARMGQAEAVWPLLRHSADPRVRSFVVNWLNSLGADPLDIVAALGRLTTAPAPRQPSMDAILFDADTSSRRALILALGTYGVSRIPAGVRNRLAAELLDMYRDDPDAGIHGAAAWTLRQWNHGATVKAVDAELSAQAQPAQRRWYVNRQGQTFAVIERPNEFRMGSPPTEPERRPDETPRRVRIPRGFAIAVGEVTVAQYQEFVRTNPDFGLEKKYLDHFSPDPNGPMIGVSWYGAAAYCNWLSQREGLPEAHWCYVPAAGRAFAEGMTIPADVLKRTGYRLPTEAEWEYACRSGAETSRYYGLSLELLQGYARFQSNSREHAWPCGSLMPNDLGLFDMLGNVFEWCQDASEHRGRGNEMMVDDITISQSVMNKDSRILRGGAFAFRSASARAANRYIYAPADPSTNFGFRPARTSP